MKYSSSSLVLVIGLSASSLVNAVPLYVKTNGDDLKDCLTWANACKTISRAATAAAAGDEINIAKGLYTFTSTLSVSGKSLSFIGGFDENALTPSGDKYSTIISGDNGGTVDTNKTASGITPSYTDIKGTNISRAVDISSGNYSFERMTFTGFQGLGGAADHHGTVIFFANSSLPGNTLTLKDVGVIGNSNTSLGVIMAYTTSPNKVFVEMDDVLCENNLGDGGVCLTLHSNAQGAAIRNSAFKGNVSIIDPDLAGWDNGVGAVWAQGTAATLDISNSLFANNKASTGASAIQADGPSLNVTNTTFADNVAQAAATIKTAGSTVTAIRYSTIYSNDGAGTNSSGGILHGNSAANSLSLFGNLILANKNSGVDQNIYAPNGTINDLGYNRIGMLGASAITGTFTKKATTLYPSEGETGILYAGAGADGKSGTADDIPLGFGYHGGLRESVKIKKGGPAYNQIPNDGIAFYGVGKSVDYPFTSLSQAHGALKSVKGYDPGIYYFDLGGVYNTAASPVTYAAGADANGRFTTYVDDQGYVLVASAELTANTVAYLQTYNLSRRTDNILNETVLKHPKLDASEVRISTYTDSTRGTFDGYTKSSTVLTKLKEFKSLPTVADGAVWTVTHSSVGTNYFAGTARTLLTNTLAAEIYNANVTSGSDGLSWVPLSNKESLDNVTNNGSANFENLDLWVRGNQGQCDGALANIDARGMPRSDRVEASEPVSACDIGSFEFNEYYKIDCVDEDGLRPENTISKYSAGLCFSDPNAVTPKAVLENFAGVAHPFYLLLLALTGMGLRLKRRRQ